jgi:uncharacterized membrane protein YccC
MALCAFAAGPLVAVAFVKLTSTPEDANVGGAFYVAVGFVAGIALAVTVLRRTRRR